MPTIQKDDTNIGSPQVGYLSNNAERLGSRNRPDSMLIAATGGFGPSTFRDFSRSAICRFTRSISVISFFDS